MGKIIIALLFLGLLPKFALSQPVIEEFEGVIKYNHHVIAKDSSYDVSYDYSALGKFSEYYYRDGDYKFVNHDCYFRSDLFKHEELKNYLLLDNSDTVLCINSRKPDVDILDFSVKRLADTIINYPCDLITIKMKPNDRDSPVSYRRYYFTRKLPVNPAHFKNCKGNAYDFIYETAQSLPLRIEFEWPNRIIVWEAYEVSKQKIDKNLFELQKNSLIEYVN